MRVSMVDLRTGEDTERQKELREPTDPVLNRLFSGDQAEPCRINGERISVDECRKSQRTLRQGGGTHPRSVRARLREPNRSAPDGRKSTARFSRRACRSGSSNRSVPSRTTRRHQSRSRCPMDAFSGPTHKFTDGERQQPGDVTVQAASGELDACYVALGGIRELGRKAPHLERGRFDPHQRDCRRAGIDGSGEAEPW